MLELDRSSTGILVVDFQEKLAAAMPEEPRSHAERDVVTLLLAAEVLGMRVVATEQYPKGLGATTQPVAEALARLLPPVRPIEKLAFSAAEVAEVVRHTAGVRSWIVAGMETHVCVYQSVRELVRRGHSVHVVSDACVSRTKQNFRIGLDLCRAAGAIVTSTEAVVFDLLGEAGTEEFRVLSRRIR